MPDDIRSSGCGSTGDGRRGRQANLQFTSERYQRKKGALELAVRQGREVSVSLPSIADGMAGSSFRLVFFKEIGKVAYERHDCHYSRSRQADEEQCFQKQH